MDFVERILGTSKAKAKKELDKVIEDFQENIANSINNNVPIVPKESTTDIDFSIIVACHKSGKFVTRIVQDNPNLKADHKLVLDIVETLRYMKTTASKHILQILDKGMGPDFTNLVRKELKNQDSVDERPVVDSSQVFGNFMRGEDDTL